MTYSSKHRASNSSIIVDLHLWPRNEHARLTYGQKFTEVVNILLKIFIKTYDVGIYVICANSSGLKALKLYVSYSHFDYYIFVGHESVCWPWKCSPYSVWDVWGSGFCFTQVPKISLCIDLSDGLPLPKGIGPEKNWIILRPKICVR